MGGKGWEGDGRGRGRVGEGGGEERRGRRGRRGEEREKEEEQERGIDRNPVRERTETHTIQWCDTLLCNIRDPHLPLHSATHLTSPVMNCRLSMMT